MVWNYNLLSNLLVMEDNGEYVKAVQEATAVATVLKEKKNRPKFVRLK